MFLFVPFVGALFPLMGIYILIVLYIIEIFRSILKGNIIHSSSCNTFCVGFRREKCLDIYSLQERSRTTYRWLVQNIECICFLLDLDLIYRFNL